MTADTADVGVHWLLRKPGIAHRWIEVADPANVRLSRGEEEGSLGAAGNRVEDHHPHFRHGRRGVECECLDDGPVDRVRVHQPVVGHRHVAVEPGIPSESRLDRVEVRQVNVKRVEQRPFRPAPVGVVAIQRKVLVGVDGGVRGIRPG